MLNAGGENTQGQAGQGHLQIIGDNEKPIHINPIQLGAQATDIQSGALHNCAVYNNNDIKCWGSGFCRSTRTW